MKTIKVKVTLGHIAMGERDKSDKCMVNLAVEDALHDQIIRANTSHEWIAIVDLECRLHFTSIPKFVRKKIVDFDAGKPVSPFEFTIDIP